MPVKTVVIAEKYKSRVKYAKEIKNRQTNVGAEVATVMPPTLFLNP